MNDLIWFSVPGAFLVAASLIAKWPFAINCNSVGDSILTAVAIPLVGFVCHQLFRVLFEWRFGFEWPKRKVISKIWTLGEKELNSHDAFLIWECTFYGKCFPEHFREHDARCWHYILSFWSGTLAAVLSAVILTCQSKVGWAIGFLVIAALLAWKGDLTWWSICDQEVQVFNKLRRLFEDQKEILCQNRNPQNEKEFGLLRYLRPCPKLAKPATKESEK
ncbi:MAG: hypothetical protein HY706_18720 [Candidatus Hydrogenedentes bacterium]|nr:hypothetical protein [Candidatus Hydrogenedentota bacterium]